jgi:DNA-binding NtrC family response regulator
MFDRDRSMMSEGAISRVLVVDDDPGTVESITRYLNREGFKVKGLSSPLAALEELETEHYGVLITDIVMPEMDGVGLAREAKERNPFLQIILITGHVRMNYVLEGFAAGASNCFFKPLDSLEPLRDEVRGCLRKIALIREVLLRRSRL